MLKGKQPVIYLRVAHGGRAAAQEQELEVRARLAASGVDSRAMHVSCDLDSPGDGAGAALLALLEEARYGQLQTVIVRDVGRLGREHAVLVAVLVALADAGVEVVVAETLEHDAPSHARLRELDRTDGTRVTSPRLTLGWGAVTVGEFG